ncbi:multicopper oxidase family protein [Mycolicibacterium hodleri]|uniref:Multicopper oxidase family protein n=1 Tax=Mycolicibacterium hodleri TaxID=49897 RepID=A0A502DRS0_9MYCO|nr:multicopper oxidase family protein [Mycolicibacterium hodleri]TPG28135.1 multicopper oxidase family protein [Mycolicibacterium hodleri]
MTGSPAERVHVSRRAFVAAGAALAGGFALAGCSDSSAPTPSAATPSKDAIAAAEAARPHTGRTVTASLTPRPETIDLGGTLAATLAYGATLPGPVIRAIVGDELAVTVANRLNHPTSVHWHGIALRNDMDGAPPATPDIGPGTDFTYRFTAAHPGTYWAHPHTGLDADTGLYLPVIIDDPREPGAYDAEWIVVLDDWTDGIGKTPTEIYDDLHAPTRPAGDQVPGMPGMGGGMSAMAGVGTSPLLGGDAGDVSYPYYLINGRIPAAPNTFTATPGQRIRIRIINAGSDTAFRVALAGHTMTVTHSDGYPIVPTNVAALLIGMGERYDVTVTARDGVFPLVALAEGKNGLARALLSTAAGTAPEATFQPPELGGRLGTVEMYTATTDVDLGPAKPDTALSATLSGGMAKYDWTINGHAFADTQPLAITQGQRATLTFTNTTMMWHPMHLHGHTFQILRADGSRGARKDTAIVLPMQTLTVGLVADNPGTWMLHCHNTYHQEAGMMTSLDYTT